jgi:energy-coupling factor transport system permease protein
MDAQQSRGYEMQKKGLINQVKNLFPLLVPLIISSIKRAFNVAEALESRAFGSTKERTYYYTIKYSKKDWIFSFYLIALLIILIIIRINFIIMPTWLKWGLPI